ncbi:hypothetical protein BB559_006577 [Furculomyces boomerangus]|uniref:BAG domain-containing protein n=2 Tax=Harpellales TaxID=61421 RepID=A0A2T9Y1P9_9FUNG|nr:hypothetical protein BB559_006577 [Furculomyces boomerangus]PVZ98804.1 hypothetical protein BB558_005190 [Smittium angustum]PVZ99367.1 hypothetical protein BB558_004617 [Smittium angustum]
MEYYFGNNTVPLVFVRNEPNKRTSYPNHHLVHHDEHPATFGYRQTSPVSANTHPSFRQGAANSDVSLGDILGLHHLRSAYIESDLESIQLRLAEIERRKQLAQMKRQFYIRQLQEEAERERELVEERSRIEEQRQKLAQLAAQKARQQYLQDTRLRQQQNVESYENQRKLANEASPSRKFFNTADSTQKHQVPTQPQKQLPIEHVAEQPKLEHKTHEQEQTPSAENDINEAKYNATGGDPDAYNTIMEIVRKKLQEIDQSDEEKEKKETQDVEMKGDTAINSISETPIEAIDEEQTQPITPTEPEPETKTDEQVTTKVQTDNDVHMSDLAENVQNVGQETNQPKKRQSPVIDSKPDSDDEFVQAKQKCKDKLCCFQDHVQKAQQNQIEKKKSRHRKRKNKMHKHKINNEKKQENQQFLSEKHHTNKKSIEQQDIDKTIAALKIQKFIRNQKSAKEIQRISNSLQQLKNVEKQVDKIRRNHEEVVYSSPLEFRVDENGSATLAYTENTRNYREYGELLLRSLQDLDSINSYGSNIVRQERRQMVYKIQSLLDDLDAYLVSQEASYSAGISSDSD